MIPFTEPYLTGREVECLQECMATGHVSGNGVFTRRCQEFFETRWRFEKCLMTTSCTDALEMCALLLDLQSGDEVIVPSYTFVSTALAFVRTGARIVFADSRKDHPGMDEASVEALITSRTRAIVVVHYAGVACDMDVIMALAEEHDLIVIEDAAQAIDSRIRDRPLGGIGHLGCFSFHETKNIQCGEGGMLVVNDERFAHRAEILWEKGTNRSAFFRGEVAKYTWVDIGSSFLPSDIIAALLWAQLEVLESIQQKRLGAWNAYDSAFAELRAEASLPLQLPALPDYATNNAHMYYIVCPSLSFRTQLIQNLREQGVHAVFHYQALHNSQFYGDKHDGRVLPECERYTDCLVRLPLYAGLELEDVQKVILAVGNFCTGR